jgi:hypothetical protein
MFHQVDQSDTFTNFTNSLDDDDDDHNNNNKNNNNATMVWNDNIQIIVQ